MSDLLRSPLHDRHEELGAKFSAFGGWSMPLEYPSGVVKEHTAVREAVGVFDVSHLGKAVVAGPGAVDFVNSTLTNDLRRIGPGQAQYTLCCDDATGGVVDDLIAYVYDEERVLLVPNAANTAEVVRRLVAAAPAGIAVTDEHRDHVGLGARGTLRTEMGYPLHGQDISLDVTPNEARLGWAVGWKKEEFWGREVLSAEREAGPQRVLRGIVATGRGIPRPHMSVSLTADVPVGEVTSGTFSPTLRKGVGLALVSAAVAPDAEVGVDIRGRREIFQLVKPPFLDPSVREA